MSFLQQTLLDKLEEVRNYNGRTNIQLNVMDIIEAVTNTS